MLLTFVTEQFMEMGTENMAALLDAAIQHHSLSGFFLLVVPPFITSPPRSVQ